MDELIKINYESKMPTVSARELHAGLEIKTAFKDWFPRMCEYGFENKKDFNPLIFEQVRTEGEREVKRQITDYQISVDMAKQICMIQRTEKGRQYRQYFLDLEKAWNTPEQILARAVKMADKLIKAEKAKNEQLEMTVAVQKQQLAEQKPKLTYEDVVLKCKRPVTTTTVASDFGVTAKWLNQLLRERGIQYKHMGVWLLYPEYAKMGYTSTKTVNGKVRTYWTQKGRLFIRNVMKGQGIAPMIERGE